jgi:ABC-2 type transport system permease protein
VLATLRPGQLLAGKIIGIGLVGLLQFSILGVVAAVLAARTHLIRSPRSNRT